MNNHYKELLTRIGLRLLQSLIKSALGALGAHFDRLAQHRRDQVCLRARLARHEQTELLLLVVLRHVVYSEPDVCSTTFSDEHVGFGTNHEDALIGNDTSVLIEQHSIDEEILTTQDHFIVVNETDGVLKESILFVFIFEPWVCRVV